MDESAFIIGKNDSVKLHTLRSGRVKKMFNWIKVSFSSPSPTLMAWMPSHSEDISLVSKISYSGAQKVGIKITG